MKLIRPRLRPEKSPKSITRTAAPAIAQDQVASIWRPDHVHFMWIFSGAHARPPPARVIRVEGYMYMYSGIRVSIDTNLFTSEAVYPE